MRAAEAAMVTSSKDQVTRPMRLFHSGLGQHFIVDDGKVYTDTDGDGYITVAEAYTGPAKSALLASAAHFSAYFEALFPGARSMDPLITSGGRLNDKEVDKFLNDPKGVIAKRPDLAAHLDFFDRHDATGMITLRQNYRGWRDLGYSRFRSLTLAIGSAIVFGRAVDRFGIDIERIAERRPKGSTGIYGPDGNVDSTRLAHFTAAFDQGTDGVLTHDRLRHILEHRSRLGRIPRRQINSLFALTERINGSKTITRKQFVALFDNSLFWTLASIPDRSGRRKL
jgi:Ca2+-binding EF-hand superfamily protein